MGEWSSNSKRENSTATYPHHHPIHHLSFHGSKGPKSGSGESESEAPSPSKGVGCLSLEMFLVWSSPVVRKKFRRPSQFAGFVRKVRDSRSPLVESCIHERYCARRVQSRRRWWEVCKSCSHGHGLAVWFGRGSEGDLLLKTRQSAHVSAQSMLCM